MAAHSTQPAQNSAPAASPRKRRAGGRPFKPGQSGNPGGRPKGAAVAARELLQDDPTSLVVVLRDIALDEHAKPSDRIQAAKEILDRGWGKAPAYAAVEDADPLGLDDVDRAIGAIVDELAAKREAPAARRRKSRAVAADGPA